MTIVVRTTTGAPGTQLTNTASVVGLSGPGGLGGGGGGPGPVDTDLSNNTDEASFGLHSRQGRFTTLIRGGFDITTGWLGSPNAPLAFTGRTVPALALLAALFVGAGMGVLRMHSRRPEPAVRRPRRTR